jgi:hypothetical protein
VARETLASLERVRSSGRKLILVTGRELKDLIQVFPQIELFDRVVAENGALLYRPSSREIELLCKPPSEEFIRTLLKRGIDPLHVGQAIVSTRVPNETMVMEVIRDLGLELRLIFNKGAVMALPPGVDKATGLRVSLKELGLSPDSVVGVGDAENDGPFLRICRCSIAVANALNSVKERTDWVTIGENGAGVVELIDKLIASDLGELESRLK